MRLVVVGAGGHARSVIDAACAAGWEIAAVVAPEGGAAEVLGHATSRDAEGIEADGYIVAIGDNAARARVYEEWATRGALAPASVVHPSAVLGGNVRIGEGCFVAAGVVVNVNAEVGANSILNTGCTVDHDCVIGRHCLIGPGTALCGQVTIGEGVLLGAGASVTPLRTVGEWTSVGAGAAIAQDIPARVVAVGVPARVTRRIEER